MRNDIGISHPTSYSINAFELLGWMQTCVQDILNDRPTEAALQLQSFISNLRSRTDLRKNISVLAPVLWSNCVDEPKYKLGIVLEGYSSNLSKDKYRLGQQFFQLVGGNAYRSVGEAREIDGILTDLLDKHNGWDNFHHEAPVANLLASYIADQSSILPNFADKLFKTVLICRIGRGVSYCDGVSPRGRIFYDHILSLAGDKFAPNIVVALASYEIHGQLGRAICRSQAKEALLLVRKNLINARLLECINYLVDNIDAMGASAILGSKFRSYRRAI